MSRRRSSSYHLTGKSCWVLVNSALLVALLSGNLDVEEFATWVTWPTQLPSGCTVEWDPSLIGEDRGNWWHGRLHHGIPVSTCSCYCFSVALKLWTFYLCSFEQWNLCFKHWNVVIFGLAFVWDAFRSIRNKWFIGCNLTDCRIDLIKVWFAYEAMLRTL